MQLPSGSDLARHMGFEPIEIEADHENALWFYTQKEATGDQLGPVGSIIVGEVFAGLLHGDPNSYFNLSPTWTPSAEPIIAGLLEEESEMFPLDMDWQLRDIIRLAQMPINGDDVRSVIEEGVLG